MFFFSPWHSNAPIGSSTVTVTPRLKLMGIKHSIPSIVLEDRSLCVTSTEGRVVLLCTEFLKYTLILRLPGSDQLAGSAVQRLSVSGSGEVPIPDPVSCGRGASTG